MVGIKIIVLLLGLSTGLGIFSKCSYDSKVVAQNKLAEAVSDLEAERNSCQDKMNVVAQACEKWGDVDVAQKVYKIKVEQCQKLIRQAALEVVKRERSAIK